MREVWPITKDHTDRWNSHWAASVRRTAKAVSTQISCVSLLDDLTIRRVKSLGGLSAIAISHPHYHTTMVDWSHAFDNAPIFLHEACRKWVMRPDKNIRFWAGERKQLLGRLTLINTLGHFTGFQVLHSLAHGEGRGALFAGDQPRPCMDRRWVSFMFSYPNFIPLGPQAIRGVVQRLKGFSYDRLYAAVPGWIVSGGADAAVKESARRYLQAIAEGTRHLKPRRAGKDPANLHGM